MTVDNSPNTHTPPAHTQDFSRFRIGGQLREELKSLGDFGCDDIFYGFPPTFTSGHLDGCKWLFGVQKHARQSWFMIFSPDTIADVCWTNLDELASARSWDYLAPLEPSAADGILTHEAVLSAILAAARRFRNKRPFG